MNSNDLHRILYKGALSLSNYHCQACEDEKKDGYNIRLHFHGSDVGKCKRAIYYDMHKKKHINSENGRESLFLNMGHRYEEILATSLKKSGDFTKVLCNDGQFDLTVNGAKNVAVDPKEDYITVEIYGHYDIVVDDYLLEIKAVNRNSFDKVFMKADLTERKQYYGQVQFYLSCLPEIKKAFLIGISRETCEIAPPIELNRDFAFMQKVYEDYAKILYYGILKGNLPTRDHENLKDYECRWCTYYSPCKDNQNVNEFNV